MLKLFKKNYEIIASRKTERICTRLKEFTVIKLSNSTYLASLEHVPNHNITQNLSLTKTVLHNSRLVHTSWCQYTVGIFMCDVKQLVLRFVH